MCSTFMLCSFKHFLVACFTLFHWHCSNICQKNNYPLQPSTLINIQTFSMCSTTTTISWSSHYVSQHLQLKTGWFCWSSLMTVMMATSAYKCGRRHTVSSTLFTIPSRYHTKNVQNVRSYLWPQKNKYLNNMDNWTYWLVFKPGLTLVV